MMRKALGCLLVLYLLPQLVQAQQTRERWVDSVFQTMSTNDKIGQLFIMKVSPDADKAELDKVERKVKSGSIGGVLFSHGNLQRQIEYTLQYKASAKIPLLIAVDGQSGIGRLTDSLNLKFPVALSQGAIANDSLIERMAEELGKAYKSLGINLNFATANTGESGSNDQFYAENRFTVTDKISAYYGAVTVQGVVVVPKAYPLRAQRLAQVQKGQRPYQLTADSIEAYPFRSLLKRNLPAMMTSAKDLPLLYTAKKKGIKNLFSEDLYPPAYAGRWMRANTPFKGVLFADLDSLKKSPQLPKDQAELFAFQIGNDIQLTSEDVDAAVRKFRKVFKKEKDLRSQLDETVKRILGLKYDAGVSRQPALEAEKALTHFQSAQMRLLRKELYRASITVIKNETTSIPVKTLDDKRFIFISADDSVKGAVVAKRLLKYAGFSHYHTSEKKALPDLNDPLRLRHVIIAAVFPNSKEETIQAMLSTLIPGDKNREIIICDFGSPAFRSFAKFFPTVVTAYADDPELLVALPEVIFGGAAADGILPVTYGQIPAGTSVSTSSLNRLRYSFPEEAGVDSKTLDKIAFIANEAINSKATPGCHVLVARKGKVIYEKSFGHLTYEKQSQVTDETIYDLASVTKVTATLQAVMFMYDKGLIDLNKKASYYLPELKKSNKEHFLIKDILTHQAGLWPFLPFWAQTVKDTTYLPEYYSRSISAQYPLVVADKLYGHVALKDSLWSWIIKSKVREKPARTPYDYRYSDMGFYMMHHLAEKVLNQPIEDFLSQNLYEPLGATTLGYLPLLRFPISQIAPTENDKLFRRALLIGTVHDQGAAMHGGVAGHAGLFGNANDLAKLGQMLLQRGEYGGIRYYRPEVVDLFASKQFETSKRGLGWDKPVTGEWNGATSYFASGKTFGHTGFTGTCIWVDPEFDLVYIFLSNRVHPDMTNNKLLTANIRSRIQDVIYQAIFNYCKTDGIEPSVPVNSTIQALGQAQ